MSAGSLCGLRVRGAGCNGWKLEGRPEGALGGEETPGRGHVREPRQRSFSKSPRRGEGQRGALAPGMARFCLSPGPQHPGRGSCPFGPQHAPLQPSMERALCWLRDSGAHAMGVGGRQWQGPCSEVRALEGWEWRGRLPAPSTQPCFGEQLSGLQGDHDDAGPTLSACAQPSAEKGGSPQTPCAGSQPPAL